MSHRVWQTGRDMSTDELFRRLERIQEKPCGAMAKCDEAFEVMAATLRGLAHGCPRADKLRMHEWADRFYHAARAEYERQTDADFRWFAD